MKKWNIEEITKALDDKPLAILWLSCIDKERTKSQISKIWGFQNPRLFSSKIMEKLEGLGLLTHKDDTKDGVLKRWLHSNLDWLVEYFIDVSKKNRESILYLYLEKIMSISSCKTKDVKDIVDSDIFRKVCMNLDFIIDEIRRARVDRETLALFRKEDRLLMEEVFGWDSHLLFYDKLRKEKEKAFRKIFKSKKKELENLEKEMAKTPWKHNFTWVHIVLNGLLVLALFKAFEENKKCLDYFKSKNLHILPIPSYDFSTKVLEMYNIIKKEGYKIPKAINPWFTMEELINELVERNVHHIEVIKRDFPEVWKEVKKRLKLKEKT